MRKTFYFPEHIKDRLLNFRKRHEMMDEQIAIIRLIDAGLRAEENAVKYKKKEVNNEPGEVIGPAPLKPFWWLTGTPWSFYK